MRGISETKMMMETAIAANESLRVPGIEGKMVAIAAATKTDMLRRVSAQTCYKKTEMTTPIRMRSIVQAFSEFRWPFQ